MAKLLFTEKVPSAWEVKDFVDSAAAGIIGNVTAYLDTYGDGWVNHLYYRDIMSIERPLLGWAAQQGQVAMIKFLLSRGADINLQSNQLDTPLMCAVMWRKAECVRVLLEAGASLDLRDKVNKTACDYACEEIHLYAGMPDIIKKLNEAHARQIASRVTAMIKIDPAIRPNVVRRKPSQPKV